MVKSVLQFLLVSSALMAAQLGQADNHAAMPAYGGVEVYACDFAEGKDMDDLMKVAKKWDKWAKKNHSKAYAGHVLTPFFSDGSDAGVYWVGFSDSFSDQGIVLEEWLEKGGDLQKEFDSVIPCNSHSQLAWVRVRDVAEAPLSTGVVDFAGCSWLPGATQEKMAAADAEMNKFLDQVGITARVYRWYPMQGNPADGLDFYQARWHDSLAAKGSDNDLYVRNGGVQLENKLYDPIMKCFGGPSALYTAVGGSE